MFRGESIPFFLMEKATEFNPGTPPTAKENPSLKDFINEVVGLEEAIKATNKRIAREGNGISSELKSHLESLKRRLGVAEERLRKYRQVV